MLRVSASLVSISFVVLSIASWRSISVYDEGIILTGAQRVLDGAIIHRDFYANYGPGHFYLLALFFKFIDQSVVVERFLDILIKSLIICMIYSVSLCYTSRILAASISIASLFWIASMGAPNYPIWTCLLLILCLIKLVIPVLEGEDGNARLVVAGCVVGIIALFRYDVGLMVFVAILPAIVLQKFACAGPLSSRLWRAFASLSLLLAGFCSICGPLAFAYLAWGSVADFVQQFYQIPATFYVRTRSLPFPTFESRIVLNRELIVYLPPLAVFLGVFSVVSFRKRRTGANLIESGADLAAPERNCGATDLIRGWDWKMVLLTGLTLFLFFKGVVRVSSLHMVLALVPSFVILGAIVFRMTVDTEFSRKLRTMRVCLVPALVLTSATSLLAAGHTFVASKIAILEFRDTRISIDSSLNVNSSGFGGACASGNREIRSRCFYLPDGASDAIRFIRQNTKPSDRIFVGTIRHDKIVVNDVAFYFLADRVPGTKWYHYDPGVQTSLDVQSRMVDDLNRAEVRYVVLSRLFDQQVEPNDSSKSSGVFLLDQYIEKHYERVQDFGFYSVLVKRGAVPLGGLTR